MGKKVITIVSVMMSMISFALGSIEAGLVFLGIGLWVEIGEAIRLYRKYKPRKEKKHKEQTNE